MENLTDQNIVLPSYIPQFDALRGLAILAVFVAHSEFILARPHGNVLQYARIGVGLFSVLACGLLNGILRDLKKS
jgi:peptidoglycan/LPS O-acetylase OafA/YrhL